MTNFESPLSPGLMPHAEMGESRRVLVVAPQPFYEDRGTPIAVRQVLEALAELGYLADVLTYPVGREIAIRGVRYIRPGRWLGIRSVPVGFSARKLVLDLAMLPELWRRLASGAYACVHAVEEAAFPAVWIARRAGVPVIYDMQSSLPEQMTKHPVFRPPAVQTVLRRSEQWLLRNAEYVVSSAGLAQQVRAKAPDTSVREWFFVSVPSAPSPEQVQQVRSRLRIPPDARVVVYTGTFERYQGLPELLRAIPAVSALVPEVLFVLVGGDGPAAAAVRHEAADLGLNGKLRLVGRLPKQDLEPYLAMADVLVSPRAYGNNLPLKIFDYLAAGRPIVATDIPSHRSVLSSERAVLVAPNAADLARGLTRVLRDPVEAARLGRAGQVFAQEHLGWTGFVRTLGEVYAQVCNPAGERADD